MFMRPTPFMGFSGRKASTWNPADKNGLITLAAGNLDASGGSFSEGSGTDPSVRGTKPLSSGKPYFEVKAIAWSVNDWFVGLMTTSGSLSSSPGLNAAGIGYWGNGRVYSGGSMMGSVSPSAAVNDVVGLAADLDARTLAVYKNGTLIGSGYTIPSGAMFPAVGPRGNATLRLAVATFSYAIPSGFSAWG